MIRISHEWFIPNFVIYSAFQKVVPEILKDDGLMPKNGGKWWNTYSRRKIWQGIDLWGLNAPISTPSPSILQFFAKLVLNTLLLFCKIKSVNLCLNIFFLLYIINIKLAKQHLQLPTVTYSYLPFGFCQACFQCLPFNFKAQQSLVTLNHTGFKLWTLQTSISTPSSSNLNLLLYYDWNSDWKLCYYGISSRLQISNDFN